MAEPIRVEVRRHTPQAPWTYALLDARQREIADEVRAGGAGALLLSEVAPVITVARRTPRSDLLLSEAGLQSQGIELFKTDRGGLATYHGPGQWVLFAVDRLDRLTGDPRGIRRAVDGLLEVAARAGREARPEAEIREGAEQGVWSHRGKFAAVGVRVEQRILLHGLAVNGFRTATSFRGLRPCGLDAPVDFLLSNPNDKAFEALGEKLKAAAFKVFWNRLGS